MHIGVILALLLVMKPVLYLGLIKTSIGKHLRAALFASLMESMTLKQSSRAKAMNVNWAILSMSWLTTSLDNS